MRGLRRVLPAHYVVPVHTHSCMPHLLADGQLFFTYLYEFVLPLLFICCRKVNCVKAYM